MDGFCRVKRLACERAAHPRHARPASARPPRPAAPAPRVAAPARALPLAPLAVARGRGAAGAHQPGGGRRQMRARQQVCTGARSCAWPGVDWLGRALAARLGGGWGRRGRGSGRERTGRISGRRGEAAAAHVHETPCGRPSSAHAHALTCGTPARPPPQPPRFHLRDALVPLSCLPGLAALSLGGFHSLCDRWAAARSGAPARGPPARRAARQPCAGAAGAHGAPCCAAPRLARPLSLQAACVAPRLSSAHCL